MRACAIIGVLFTFNIFLFFTVPAQGLTVAFFDVGQGDAIFIEGPSGVQVVVDTGPDASVLRGLGTHMPFWDRSIDALVLTHPDADHIGGAVDVLERYAVGHILEPDVPGTTRLWERVTGSIETEVDAGAGYTVARAGVRLDLGGGAYADILFPTRDVSGVKDTNAGSIVMRIVYGETAFMLTGDAPSSVEQELFLQWGYGLDADVLKAGHHGSKTSSLPDFVESVSPEYVVFSRGCENRYGHPAPSVVTFFESEEIKILDTCEDGTVWFSTDGKALLVKPLP